MDYYEISMKQVKRLLLRMYLDNLIYPILAIEVQLSILIMYVINKFNRNVFVVYQVQTAVCLVHILGGELVERHTEEEHEILCLTA